MRLGAHGEVPPEAAAVAPASEPLNDSTGLQQRIHDLEEADLQYAQAAQQTKQAGALAATTLAAALQIPSLEPDSVTHILRELFGKASGGQLCEEPGCPADGSDGHSHVW